MRSRRALGVVGFLALVILVLCTASGCGRKAKPEPLRTAARHSVIQKS